MRVRFGARTRGGNEEEAAKGRGGRNLSSTGCYAPMKDVGKFFVKAIRNRGITRAKQESLSV